MEKTVVLVGLCPKVINLLGIDASGLELRMLAHYMNDEEYIDEVINGDIHKTNQELAGLESRDKAKNFHLCTYLR